MYREDGLGAQVTSLLWHMALAMSDTAKYRWFYFPFQFFNHYVNDVDYDLSQYERFTNLGEGETNTLLLDEAPHCVHWNLMSKPPMAHLKNEPSRFFNQTVRSALSAKYFANKKGYAVFSEEHSLNVAVHIRRGDVATADEKRIIKAEYYAALMRYLFDELRQQESQDRVILFHVFSEWNFERDEFESLLSGTYGEMYDDGRFAVEYHLNTGLAQTYHGLISADALIMSRSALSWSAAILSRAKYIVHCKGRERAISEWISCSVNRKDLHCYQNNTLLLT